MADLTTLAILTAGAATGAGLLWLQPRMAARRARRRLVTWERVARERKLDWHADGQRLSGWDGNHYVSAWSVSHDSRLANGTWVSAVLWPPLDLGLRLRKRFSLAAPAQLTLGADDQRRARRLLTKELEQAIYYADPHEVRVTDKRVMVGVAQIVDASTLEDLLALVRRIADQVDAARASVSALRIEQKAHARLLEEWVELGRSLHFVATMTPFGFVGQHRDLELRYFIKRSKGADYRSCAMAAFRTPLKIGLSAWPSTLRREVPWSTRRVPTGDPEFDQRLQVYAFEPEYVSAVLHDRARARLCELCASCPDVFVDDYGVRVESELIGAARLRELIDHVASVAEVVDFIRPERGPYR